MLYSTVELISLASSNSLVAFCFCNILIAILLVGSLKPCSDECNEEMELTEFPSVHDENNFKKPEVQCPEKLNELIIEAEEEQVSTSVSITIVDNQEEEEERCDDDDEDELRKRVEEFIEKTNRGWMAEKLKFRALGQ